MQITLVLQDQEKLDRAIESLATILLRMGNADRNKIADAVRQGIAENFTTESAGGDPWPPLAVSTVAQRRRLGFPGEHPILQRSRQLKMGWTERGHPNHAEWWRNFGAGLRLVLTNEDKKVGWQSGENPNIPPRLQNELSEQSLDHLEDVVEYVVEEAMKRIT